MDIHKACAIYYVYFILSMYQMDAKCNSFCKCDRKQQSASCFNLTFIPRLPNFVRHLELQNNTFPHIRRDSFLNVSANNLTRLLFKNNQILTFASDSFVDLKYLQRLIVNDEKRLNITTLQLSFNSLKRLKIDGLFFDNNGWREMPSNMFTFFNGANLALLTLDYNRLRTLDTAVFRPFNNVRKLSCKGNIIAGFTSIYLFLVEELDLSDNNINDIPNFCLNGTSSLVPKLKTISLAYNAIKYISPGAFECLNNVQNLTLDGNPIKRLNNNIFSNLHGLLSLHISYITQLKFISSFAFNNTSLKSLQFVKNSFRFDKRKFSYDIANIFRFLPSLQEINLGHNYLPRNDSEIFTMFQNLTKLRKLTLPSSFLTNIPESLLQKMPYLETLNLQGNKISKLNQTMFQNMLGLRYLHLDGNDLHIINKTSFPAKLLKSLKVLQLSNNPFWCTCDLTWFLETIRSTNLIKKLSNWPMRYTCYYPDKLRFTLLADYFPTDAECSPFKAASLIIIAASSSVLIILLFVIITFRCQSNIKNILYLLSVYQRIKRGYIRLNSSEDFEFDAFIVYCDMDRQWVHNVLLNKLESTDLKICVHYRDFDLGEHIATNIERFIEKSWKIIVVMSNNFARSEWCQWEVDFVQERRRKQGKDALVLIMYQQIDSHHMTSPLRTLLATTQYITYKEGFGERLFWKAVIKDVKKPLNFRPTAML